MTEMQNGPLGPTCEGCRRRDGLLERMADMLIWATGAGCWEEAYAARTEEWRALIAEAEATKVEKCQVEGCGKDAVFAIFDTQERRPDITGTLACEDHLGSLIGSVPPTSPDGPWSIYNAQAKD